jgi:hypothetical protein
VSVVVVVVSAEGIVQTRTGVWRNGDRKQTTGSFHESVKISGEREWRVYGEDFLSLAAAAPGEQLMLQP